VARQLLGMALLRRDEHGQLCGGWIVETEAYLAHGDSASHSHRGQSPRNASMFATPGTLYVYSIHAKFCMNVSTEAADIGSAVLIRAIEPAWGIETMSHRRGVAGTERRLTGGPAMLCQALDVTKQQDGQDLIASDTVWIATVANPPSFRLQRTPRIGVTSATTARLRYFIDGNPFVSGRRGDHSQTAFRRLHEDL